MSRRKRLSATLEKAEIKAAPMDSIAPKLDLGNGRTLKIYSKAINGMRAKQQLYNGLLSTGDSLYNELLENERVWGRYRSVC
jgi:hypothetical protein